MDLTIVDVSSVPGAATGDEVVILGEQNGQRVTADDHARWAETISYEILCAIGARVPRIVCD
jgi:alanine racemase